jgi:hypothetical protein
MLRTLTSVVEDRQLELTEAGGVDDHVDLDDLPVPDLEGDHPGQASARSHDDSHASPTGTNFLELARPPVRLLTTWGLESSKASDTL